MHPYTSWRAWFVYADHANPGAWQTATDGRNTAGSQPVHENADPANLGT